MDNYKKLFEPYVDFSMDTTCLRDVVYRGLKKAIVEGKIQTGSRIVEKRFADQMNISRTPVREALKKLEQEGFVEHVPNVGSVVKCVDANEVHSLYKAKVALEAIVYPEILANVTEQDLLILKELLKNAEGSLEQRAMEAVARHYLEFQMHLIGIGQNKMIFTLLKSLDKSYDRSRRTLDFHFEDYARIFKASWPLIDAIESKDLAEALSLNDIRHQTICSCILNRMSF